MSGSRAKSCLTSLLAVLLALPALAQSPSGTVELLPPPDRDASFTTVSPSADSGAGFSGLAAAPPTGAPLSLIPAAPATLPASEPAAGPAPQAARTPAPPAGAQTAILAAPVSVAPLPNVSPESVGAQGTDSLGADMWKGTPRHLADALLAQAAPTRSSILNQLARRLLVTAAVPPEGDGGATSLISARIVKLIAFGSGAEAWALAQQGDPKLIGDTALNMAAENALTLPVADPCAKLPELKGHSGADWQRMQIVCQLRAKDNNAAQVGLDIMRTQSNRDMIFIDTASKVILGGEKKLPFRLTPLTAPVLALLQMAALPLPDELYAHTDPGLIPGLLRTPAQQDVAQLSLAENAAQRGIVGSQELGAVYRGIRFDAAALADPLKAPESGLRLRALLFQAAQNEKDPGKRLSYAVKFAQSCQPAFLSGAGGIIADMIGDARPDVSMALSAVTVARVYMLGGRNDDALAWLRVAQTNSANAGELQALWPQFVLGGLEPESAYGNDVGRWIDAALKPGDQQTAPSRAQRENVAASLMMLDAAGFKIPDEAWARVLDDTGEMKKFSFPPVMFDRLRAAGKDGKKAEAVLLALIVAGDNDISLPEAVTIARALREAGFKAESARFAQQVLAVANP